MRSPREIAIAYVGSLGNVKGVDLVGVAEEAVGAGVREISKEHDKEIESLRAKVEDDERWMREMLTDYRIQFDDHTVGRRSALNDFIHKLRAEVKQWKSSHLKLGDEYVKVDTALVRKTIEVKRLTTILHQMANEEEAGRILADKELSNHTDKEG